MSCCNKEGRCSGASLLGMIFLLFVGGVIIACIPEIKRYIKISSM